MPLQPSDYVGWTVVVHESDCGAPTGIFYCVGLIFGGTELQLAKSGDARNPNACEDVGINWWVAPEYVTRLRQGDFAQ